jgi:hypothetical protein
LDLCVPVCTWSQLSLVKRAEIDAAAEEAQRSCGEARVFPVLADVAQPRDCDGVVETTVRKSCTLRMAEVSSGAAIAYPTHQPVTL